jgi:NAD(P)-dependent dehydrogenase (short-subunit alcohol dehydrogenase family)
MASELPGAGRTVVVTGASRGLGLATATHLYRRGWHVLCAMRSPDAGLARFRSAIGGPIDEGRVSGVRLDLEDDKSIAAAARTILDSVGAPDGVVHNAAMAVAGCAEEIPMDFWRRLLQTNLLGPISLTDALLPAMRDRGQGRFVVISSQGGIRAFPSVSAYAASKSALERWAEALAGEIAPFGLGLSILIPGVFKTDILEETQTYADFSGPYAELHTAIDHNGRRMVKLARPVEKFAPAVERALLDTSPFARRPVGPDAVMLYWANKLLPAKALHHGIGKALGIPRAVSRTSDPGGTTSEMRVVATSTADPAS